MIDQETFSRGAGEYGPIPMWGLNGLLEDEELLWQMDQMKTQGIGGFFIFPVHGLITPYLSDEWFDKVRLIVERAEKLGMRVYLYDEESWPSGMSGGRVTLKSSEYEARKLVYCNQEVTGPTEIQISLPWGNLVRVVAMRQDQVETGEVLDLTAKVGTGRSVWFFDSVSGYYDGLSKDGPMHDRSGLNQPEQRLLWQVPAGRWVIHSFIEVKIEDFKFWGTYLDVLNPDAVDYFLETTHEQYAKHVGRYFGSVIKGIFTDEPAFGVKERAPWRPQDAEPVKRQTLPWTTDFLAYFQLKRGYDLADQLPALFEDFGPQTCRVRCDYWRTLSERFGESYLGRIRRWCDENRLELLGHLDNEEDIIETVRHSGSYFTGIRHFSIPGIDTLFARVGDASAPHLNILPKLAASARETAMRQEAGCECFGLGPKDFTLADMKRICDWLMVLGVNRLYPYLLRYSIGGLRKREGASYFFQNPYWPHSHLFYQYAARLSFMLAQGRRRCQIGLLYPLASAWAHHDEPEMHALRDDLLRLTDRLVKHHLDFDLLDETMLADEGQIKDGVIHLGDGRYSTLLMPPMLTIWSPLIPSLNEFVSQGGRLIAVGTLPGECSEFGPDPRAMAELWRLFGKIEDPNPAFWHDGNGASGKTALCGGGEWSTLLATEGTLCATEQAWLPLLLSILKQERTVEMQLTSPEGALEDLLCHHRATRAQEILFLVNLSEKDLEFTVKLNLASPPNREAFKLNQWDLERGVIEPLPPVRVDMTGDAAWSVRFSQKLVGYESRMLVLERT